MLKREPNGFRYCESCKKFIPIDDWDKRGHLSVNNGCKFYCKKRRK